LKPFPISDFFKLLLLTGRVLSRLKTALIVPVPKKGNLCQIQNYRPISLTEPLRKLLEHCLLKFINTKISPSFLTQGGFRTNHCCNDMIIVLQETAPKYKSNLHTAFLDTRQLQRALFRQFTNCCALNSSKKPLLPLTKSLKSDSPEIVSHLILRSPAGKAPGISGISAELLQPVPRFFHDFSVFICHCPWSHLYGSGLLVCFF
jgi:hypothetical protein